MLSYISFINNIPQACHKYSYLEPNNNFPESVAALLIIIAVISILIFITIIIGFAYNRCKKYRSSHVAERTPSDSSDTYFNL